MLVFPAKRPGSLPLLKSRCASGWLIADFNASSRISVTLSMANPLCPTHALAYSSAACAPYNGARLPANAISRLDESRPGEPRGRPMNQGQPTPKRPLRILSGVQPSGKLHLGNYFGAVKQHIELQNEGVCFYFIADYHALTTIQDPARLRAFVHDAALDYLALGLDPDKAIFFRQSDVPQVTEL